MMRMIGKVLWLTKGLDPGGVEILLRDLADEPALAPFEKHLAVVQSSHMSLRGEFESLGVTVHDLAGRHSADPRWVAMLGTLLIHNAFDIVHAHSPLPASLARILVRARPGRAPSLVCTEHSVRALYRPATRFLNGLTSRLDDERIAVSEAAAGGGKVRGGRNPTVVYHGRKPALVGPAVVREVRRELGLSDIDRIVVNIANMRTEKNIALLVDAFASLKKALPGTYLVLVGDGTCRKSLESQVSRLGLVDHVRFVGFQPDGRRYLSGADVFALSSDSEGLPVAAMEALQAGVPIVGTRVGGMSELVRHGINGLLVERGDVGAFAEMLLAILKDDSLRDCMSRAAKATSQKFSIESAAAWHAKLYRALIDNRMEWK